MFDSNYLQAINQLNELYDQLNGLETDIHNLHPQSIKLDDLLWLLEDKLGAEELLDEGVKDCFNLLYNEIKAAQKSKQKRLAMDEF